MIRSLKDILVVSDMDGTLVDAEKTLRACDLETVRLFTQLGGHFTVASGRTMPSVALYKELVKCLEPAIVSGGCMIYDFKQEKALKSMLLPQLSAQRALRDITQNFPHVGAVVTGADTRMYQVEPSEKISKLLRDEKMQYLCRPVDTLPEPWIKILYADFPEELAKVAEFLKGRDYPGLYFIFTAPVYLEMMPNGASKGNALQDLCDILDIPIENTIAIGDYYNDLDIMRKAGYAVAMGTAPDEVKAAANEVTASAAQGGVGQFLYKLIQKYA